MLCLYHPSIIQGYFDFKNVCMIAGDVNGTGRGGIAVRFNWVEKLRHCVQKV